LIEPDPDAAVAVLDPCAAESAAAAAVTVCDDVGLANASCCPGLLLLSALSVAKLGGTVNRPVSNTVAVRHSS
jgi:hypothetical protein